MLLYKLFPSFKIDGAMNCLSRQVAQEDKIFFPRTKNTRLLNFWFWWNVKTVFILQKPVRTDVCLFVCLSVGMWSANGNPNPCTDLGEILHAHPHLSKEGLSPGLNPAHSPPGPGELETLKPEGHIFKMLSRLQINPGSAGYLS